VNGGGTVNGDRHRREELEQWLGPLDERLAALLANLCVGGTHGAGCAADADSGPQGSGPRSVLRARRRFLAQGDDVLRDVHRVAVAEALASRAREYLGVPGDAVQGEAVPRAVASSPEVAAQGPDRDLRASPDTVRSAEPSAPGVLTAVERRVAHFGLGSELAALDGPRNLEQAQLCAALAVRLDPTAEHRLLLAAAYLAAGRRAAAERIAEAIRCQLPSSDAATRAARLLGESS
jgi:hypothetical protein